MINATRIVICYVVEYWLCALAIPVSLHTVMLPYTCYREGLGKMRLTLQRGLEAVRMTGLPALNVRLVVHLAQNFDQQVSIFIYSFYLLKRLGFFHKMFGPYTWPKIVMTKCIQHNGIHVFLELITMERSLRK